MVSLEAETFLRLLVAADNSSGRSRRPFRADRAGARRLVHHPAFSEGVISIEWHAVEELRARRFLTLFPSVLPELVNIQVTPQGARYIYQISQRRAHLEAAGGQYQDSVKVIDTDSISTFDTHGRRLERSEVGQQRVSDETFMAGTTCTEDQGTPIAIQVFYSYSRFDSGLLNKFRVHMSGLRHSGAIEEWYDRMIVPGDDFSKVISEKLEQANLILLMVSPGFIASEYIASVELKRAIERHNEGTARVIPVILRPVEWEKAPFGFLQALPTDGKAVVKWKIRDNAWLDVVTGISRTIAEMKNENIRSL